MSYVSIFINYKELMSIYISEDDIHIATFFDMLAIRSTECSIASYGSKAQAFNRKSVSSIILKDPVSSSSNIKDLSGIIIVIPEIILNRYQNPDETLNMVNIINGDIFNYSIGHCIIKSWVNTITGIFKCGLYDVCTHTKYILVTDKPTSSIMFNAILTKLLMLLPDQTTLWLGIDPNNNKFLEACGLYTKFGFKNPYFSYKDCFGSDFKIIFPYGMVNLTRLNDYDGFELGKDRNNVMLEIIYTLQQQIFLNTNGDPNLSCTLQLFFNINNAQYLRNLALYSSTYNIYGYIPITQKEIGGALSIKPLQSLYNPNVNTNILWEISSVIGQKTYGTERSVNNFDARYNFHTHPREAYKTDKVTIGFPSGADYSAFLYCMANYNTIFHCTVTLEGIYTISLAAFWTRTANFNILMKDFITDVYINSVYSSQELINYWEKPKSSFTNAIQYTTFINSQIIDPNFISKFIKNVDLYNELSKQPLFNCTFLSYEDISKLKTFEIYYHRLGDPLQCFATMNEYNNYIENT